MDINKEAEQLINDLYVTFQNDNTLKQVRINIVLQFARETAEAQRNECSRTKPGDQLQTDNKQGEIYLRQWNVKNSLLVTDTGYRPLVTSSNTGDNE